jgi:hypothetical protein
MEWCIHGVERVVAQVQALDAGVQRDRHHLQGKKYSGNRNRTEPQHFGEAGLELQGGSGPGTDPCNIFKKCFTVLGLFPNVCNGIFGITF